jgi:hypothetical protein
MPKTKFPSTPPVSFDDLVSRALIKYPKARKIAVQNFAGTCDRLDYGAEYNLAQDARDYAWNVQTINAIRWTIKNKGTIRPGLAPEPPAPKPAQGNFNPYLIPLDRALAMHGIESVDLWAQSPQAMDSVQPCLCEDGCEAEPDGHCQHGCPSLTLALGLI